MIVKKSSEELKTINTPNLLRYLKAERKRFYSFKSSHTCDCCGEKEWDLHPKSPAMLVLKNQYLDWIDYINIIRAELSTREHVELHKNSKGRRREVKLQGNKKGHNRPHLINKH